MGKGYTAGRCIPYFMYNVNYEVDYDTIAYMTTNLIKQNDPIRI